MAEYVYRDEDGTLVGKVVRGPNKSFRQMRLDPKSGWINGLNGARLPLYRLQGVQEAIGKSEWVFSVEGEQDADSMAALGLAATTNAGGAGKWLPEHSQALRGARVAVIADNDDAGRKHGDFVYASLEGVAERVVQIDLRQLVPDCPPGFDVSDWIEDKDSLSPNDLREALLELADSASPVETGVDTSLEAIRIADVESEEVEWLAHPYLPIGKLTLLDGNPGDGKSFVSLAIAAALSQGRSVLPGSSGAREGVTLIIGQEDGPADTIRPRLESLGADLRRVFVWNQGIDLTNDQDRERLESLVRRYKPLLLVFDPLVSYVGSKTDTYRANQVRPILDFVASLAERFRLVALGIRHLTKERKANVLAMYRGQGSIDFVARARSVLVVGPNGDRPRFGLVQIKNNLCPCGRSLEYEIDEEGFRWIGASDLTATDLLNTDQEASSTAVSEAGEFLRVELRDGPLPSKEVYRRAAEAGVSGASIRRAKRPTSVKSRKQGKNGPWVWCLEGEDDRVPRDHTS